MMYCTKLSCNSISSAQDLWQPVTLISWFAWPTFTPPTGNYSCLCMMNIVAMKVYECQGQIKKGIADSTCPLGSPTLGEASSHAKRSSSSPLERSTWRKPEAVSQQVVLTCQLWEWATLGTDPSALAGLQMTVAPTNIWQPSYKWPPVGLVQPIPSRIPDVQNPWL